jgi:hypothetical protein
MKYNIGDMIISIGVHGGTTTGIIIDENKHPNFINYRIEWTDNNSGLFIWYTNNTIAANIERKTWKHYPVKE